MLFILGFIAILLAGAGLALSIVSSRRLRQLEMIVSEQRKYLSDREAGGTSTWGVLEPGVLSGLAVYIQVKQDHKTPTFQRGLAKELESRDVKVTDVPGEADLTIEGTVECNGYSEMYWTAEFTVSDKAGSFLTISEKPAHGDRQANLAMLVTKAIEKEVGERTTRSERQKALGELG